MAIVKRVTKGSALTHAELDNNFTELEAAASTSKTTTERDAIVSPTAGMQIFNSTNGWFEYYESAFWGWMPVSPTAEWRRKFGYEYFNDFLIGGTINDGNITTFGSSTNGTAGENNRPGIINVQTGSGATAGAGLMGLFGASGPFGIGASTLVTEWGIRIPVLSNGTNRYVIHCGQNAENADGYNWFTNCTFIYDEGGVSSGNTASPNFKAMTANGGGASTFVDAGVAVVANTWYALRVEITDQTSAVFKINGTTVATITTNIPDRANPQCVIKKALGSSDMRLQVDYLMLRQKFNTSR